MKPIRFAVFWLVLAAHGIAAQPPGADGQPPDPATVEVEENAGDTGAGTAPDGPATPELSPRGHYNQGLEHLAAGDTQAAVASFLIARDNAGPDPELRYRAAFNLGLALATQADAPTPAGAAAAAPAQDDASEQEPLPGAAPPATEPASPEETLALLRQSAAWFNDAVRLAPAEDEDARMNLELVSRRILQLADRLNEGDKLEGRLDRLIDDQRGVRDQVRRLLGEVLAQEASAAPLGFKNEFDNLASRQRVLMAEVGETIDLATEERLFIEQTPPDQRTAERGSRAQRLAAVTDYLERARQSLSDARRRLRRLQGERAHRRADGALAELKRAREQLRDPLTVLKAVAQDEGELIVHTAAFAALRDDAIDLDGPAPAWLTPKHLAERQEDVAVRAGGVLTVFEAMLAAGARAAEPGAQDANRTQAAVAEAAPVLNRGLASMRDAMQALAGVQPARALAAQNEALAALRDAIEMFADIKGLVELAYAGQRDIVALLTPNDENPKDLEVTERAKVLADLIFAGQRQLGRLGPLLAEETAKAEESASGTSGPGEPGGEAQPPRQSAKQLYELAEKLRAESEDGLARLAEAVDAIGTGGGDPALARDQAARTLATLEQLRRLFFSVVEHLQALHADQAQTHDQTATAQFESTVDKLDALPAELGAIAERQTRHTEVGEQLANALARQADAAAAGGTEAAAPQAAGTPSAEHLAEAAEEVRKGAGRMQSAAAALVHAAARAGAMSPELEPTLTDQTAAMEHLENALRALAPDQPPRDSQGDGEQQQAEQQAAQQTAPENEEAEDEKMSRRQALRRLQAIRDREAERQRRRQQAEAGREPVEKDW